MMMSIRNMFLMNEIMVTDYSMTHIIVLKLLYISQICYFSSVVEWYRLTSII